MAKKRIEDPKKPEETITHNSDMNNMLLLIDYACTMSRRPLAGRYRVLTNQPKYCMNSE